MGCEFEIYKWWLDISTGEGYKYKLEWQGESLMMAILVMFKLKREGATCLKLEWRP